MTTNTVAIEHNLLDSGTTMIEEFPCQRCGIDITEFSVREPESGTWQGAQLCYKCMRETSVLKKKRYVKKK